MITPERLIQELPLSAAAAHTVSSGRQAIRAILRGHDRRLLVITGPCSVHDASSALDYAERLRALSDELDQSLLLVMRVYLEKPRTTVGWKGFLNDPDLDGSCDVEQGLRAGRSLLREILELGVPCATEALDPLLPAYLQDAYSWMAIGARTSESQTHRELASGLPLPVGFKNGTDGSLAIAVNAVQAARAAHRHMGIGADGLVTVRHTDGNPDAHIVLRGGERQTNYRAASIARAEQALRKAGLSPRLLVDCSHANSRKDHRRQPRVAREVVRQVAAGNDHIIGLMLESNIGAGNQPLAADLRYGVSVTDACIDWPTTERCLREFADRLAARPSGAALASAEAGEQPEPAVPACA